jgi:hypothetical protein
MCKLSVEGSSWVEVSSWECDQDGFRDFPDVSEEIFKHIRGNFKNDKIEIFYLCGAGKKYIQVTRYQKII